MSQITYTATQLSPADDAVFEDGLERVRASLGEHRLLIGDAWSPGAAGVFEERNPARIGEVLGVFAEASAEDVERAVAAARAAQRAWARVAVAERIEVLERAATLIERRAGEVAATLTLEVGKNRLESMGEVAEASELIRYYASQAEAGFDIPLAVANAADENVSVMRPFGVFGVVAPFNFPL